MEEITINELVNLLREPLETEGMKASEIMLLKQNFSRVRPGRGISMNTADKINRKLNEYSLPEGTLSLPIQYATGEYNDGLNKYPVSQSLATVFNSEFFEGNSIRTDSDEPYRPLVDGYLDFRDDKVLDSYVSEFNSDEGDQNPEFERAYKFRNGLWIGDVDDDNAEELIFNHLKGFRNLYGFRKFLIQPLRELIENAFKPKSYF